MAIPNPFKMSTNNSYRNVIVNGMLPFNGQMIGWTNKMSGSLGQSIWNSTNSASNVPSVNLSSSGTSGFSIFAAMLGTQMAQYVMQYAAMKKFNNLQQAPAQQATNAQVTSANQSTSSLKSAVKTANRTGDWAPVKAQVISSQSQFDSNQSQINTIQTQIDGINKTQIPADEKKLTDLDTSDKQIDDNLTKVLGDIDNTEKTHTDLLQQEIAAAKSAVPQRDTSALEAQLQKVKQNAEHERTIAKNQAEDAKKRNQTKREEINKDIESLKEQINDLTNKKNQLQSANDKLNSEIQEVKSDLGDRGIDVDSSKAQQAAPTQQPAVTSQPVAQTPAANASDAPTLASLGIKMTPLPNNIFSAAPAMPVLAAQPQVAQKIPNRFSAQDIIGS